MDFAFSLPGWFLEERGLRSARELWRAVDRKGENWLDRCAPPFWGRPGTTKPDDLPAHYRKTEQEVRQATGAWPKSPFQVGGAGAVGTGSLRGMPHLLELSEGGFSIWPFDEPSLPLVVEIYPRLLTGEVVKSDRDARLAYLRREYLDLAEEHREEAAASEDAFDATVSALVMDARSRELSALEHSPDPVTRLEGAIWRPERSDRSGGQGLDEALVYARTLHEGQQRKGPEETPYFAHLLGTCSLVLEAGGDEEQAVAALLHDAAEDQGGQGGRETLEEIRERFGGRVARIVHGCSDTMEQPKPPWRERKEAYLDALPDEPEDTLLVSCADKVYNARSMLRDHRIHGDALWDRFRSSAEDNLWYYRGLVDAFRASGLESWLVDELEWTVERLADRVSHDRGCGV